MKLDILNAKTGHTTISFDTSKQEEIDLAKSQIDDMLRMGYAVFIEYQGQTIRVKEFDKHKGVYKIGAREIPADAPATAIAPSSGGCVALKP